MAFKCDICSSKDGLFSGEVKIYGIKLGLCANCLDKINCKNKAVSREYFNQKINNPELNKHIVNYLTSGDDDADSLTNNEKEKSAVENKLKSNDIRDETQNSMPHKKLHIFAVVQLTLSILGSVIGAFICIMNGLIWYCLGILTGGIFSSILIYYVLETLFEIARNSYKVNSNLEQLVNLVACEKSDSVE